MTQICKKCGVLKSLEEFVRDTDCKNGRSGTCKICRNKRERECWRISGRAQKQKAWMENWRVRNREWETKYKREYYLINKDKIREYNKKKYWENKEARKIKYGEQNRINKLASYHRNKHKYVTRLYNYRRRLDCKLRQTLRARVNDALEHSFKTGSAIGDLGCSIEQLKRHLESQFALGMNWENHGHKGWHIDHIIPLASFDLMKREELIKAVHYTNLRPLWARDNLSKGSKMEATIIGGNYFTS